MSSDRAPSVLLVLASSGWGGTEKAVVDLANALASRCSVSLAVPHDAVYRHRLGPGLQGVHELRPGSRRNPASLRHLSRIIRDVNPAVVHSHAARATEMVYWVGRFRPLVHVATKHNTRRRRIFGRIPWVTAVSRAAAASIEARADVAVVYDGIEVREVARAEKAETFTVLGVGRLHVHKGFDTLIRAVAELPGPLALELVGEGPERPALEKLVRSSGLGGRVTLLGHREDVPELMARAHVQVVPSRTEGFGIALVEGLHYCDVVLSTRVGVAEEILPGELLVGAAEIAERLGDVRARYGDYVRITADVKERVGERFLLAHTVERYLEVYERARAG